MSPMAALWISLVLVPSKTSDGVTQCTFPISDILVSLLVSSVAVFVFLAVFVKHF